MSENIHAERLDRLTNFYSTEIRAALLREDDQTAERLGRAYDKRATRLAARRDRSPAPLRHLARRLTPSRAA